MSTVTVDSLMCHPSSWFPCHAFICSYTINQKHVPTHFCRLRACAFACSISQCVCICVLTFPSFQFRGFLGNGLLKTSFFPSAVSSGTYYSLRHFHKRAIQLPLHGPEWDSVTRRKGVNVASKSWHLLFTEQYYFRVSSYLYSYTVHFPLFFSFYIFTSISCSIQHICTSLNKDFGVLQQSVKMDFTAVWLFPQWDTNLFHLFHFFAVKNNKM